MSDARLSSVQGKKLPPLRENPTQDDLIDRLAMLLDVGIQPSAWHQLQRTVDALEVLIASLPSAPADGTVVIPMPVVAPFDISITADGVQAVWEVFVRPGQDNGKLQSVEDRMLMAILRSVYAGLNSRGSNV